jgi:hypothetical protein
LFPEKIRLKDRLFTVPMSLTFVSAKAHTATSRYKYLSSWAGIPYFSSVLGSLIALMSKNEEHDDDKLKFWEELTDKLVEEGIKYPQLVRYKEFVSRLTRVLGNNGG